MRKIVSELFITLDGVVSSPDKWHGPYHDEAMNHTIEEQLAAADTMLLGRHTYQEHAGFWPGETGTMADRMNSIRKIVFSTTLTGLEWSNSTLAAGTAADVIARLKRQEGTNVLITGSPTLVRGLLRDRLLDEIRLLIDPIVVGAGSRLFEDVHELGLDLVGSQTFDTGCVAATYRIP
ncbi:dihydrofolate reductase family protein [Actinoallomurus sp. CA-142502]|uniref:dihydrofolate reductase family protein n=1 Tax=Actinoallomurus sp. CA-142502 TaxID=3239885 RepID=UPI003D8CE0B0